METKNNSPETHAKPTNSELVRIFMQYPDQTFTSHEGYEFDGISNCPAISFITFGYGGIIFNDGRGSGRRLGTISVNVKPLKMVSNEDYIKVFQIWVGEDFLQNQDKSFIIDQGRKIVEKIFSNNRMSDPSVTKWIEIIGFLRERGYALPYKNWSVEELVEFRIYKLIG